MSDRASLDPLVLLEEGCGSVFPGAVAWVDLAGQCRLNAAAGLSAVEPAPLPAAPGVHYDLASLTKPVAAITLLLEALASGALALDTPASSLLPDAPAAWGAISVRHLAGHTSGLPAFRALDPRRPRADLLATPLLEPPGTRAVYSDFGYIALGWVLEAALGADLRVLLESVRTRYRLGDTGFRTTQPERSLAKDPAMAPRIAPTERGVPVGVVHDPNARILGGAAGHAGLFGAASDVGRWARVLLDDWRQRGPLGAWLDRLWYEPSVAHHPTTWRLGFDTVTPGGSSAGRYFGSRAVGHLGYTGTSLWMEPDLDLIVVLLSNRVHPVDQKSPSIRSFRPLFHDAVVRSLDLQP